MKVLNIENENVESVLNELLSYDGDAELRLYYSVPIDVEGEDAVWCWVWYNVETDEFHMTWYGDDTDKDEVEYGYHDFAYTAALIREDIDACESNGGEITYEIEVY